MNIAKKVIVYSMVCIMPIGFGASVIEASPKDKDQHNERHNRALRDIAALLIGIAIGSSSN